MKRVKKSISVLLIFVLLLTITPTKAYALPRTFNKTRVNLLDAYIVTLDIGDMTFQGKITLEGLTDEKLEELVQKTLESRGMNEASFDILNELVEIMDSHDTITEEQKNKIIDRWLTMIGAMPVVGTGFTVLQIVLQMSHGRFGDAGGSTLMEIDKVVAKAGTEIWNDIFVTFGDVGDVADVLHIDNLGGKVANGLSIAQGLAVMVEDIADPNVGFGKRTRDRAAGMEAYRQIADFYYRLNNNIEYELNKNIVVKFDKAKASKTFTFFGEEFTETWTLDMKLFMVESETLSSIDGTYEGQYTIEIDYGLSDMADALANDWEYWMNSPPGMDCTVTMTDSGMAAASRTLEGKAEANIHRRSTSNCTIHPNQSSDKKSVNVFGIAFHSYDRVDTGEGVQIENRDIEFFADELEISFHHKNFVDIAPDGNTFTLPDYTETYCTWEDCSSIYQRGDKAKEGWKVRITPTGKK